MNKTELIAAAAEKAGVSKKEAEGSSITQQKQIIVKGIVKDENGEPVVGANVVERGRSSP